MSQEQVEMESLPSSERPASWTKVPLGQIADVQLGKMLDKKKQVSGSEYFYLRNANVQWRHIDLEDLLRFRLRDDELGRYAVQAGDVLICEGGEPGRAAVLRSDHANLKYQKALHRVRGGGALVPDWLVYHLEWEAKSGQLNRHFTGSTIKHFPRTKVRKYQVWLAPLPEQHRIVAAIDTQFSRLDAAVASLERARANVDRAKASVLKAAVEGRLVPTEAELARREGRGYEPAEVLLGRIDAPPRPNRWKSRSKKVILGHAALAVNNPETELPEGWSWVQLADIARMESGHTPSRKRKDWWDGNVPWIGIKDARAHHGRVIHETLQYTNEQGLENSAARLLPEGTVCLSRTASVGYVTIMGKSMATSQDFVNWAPTDALTSQWLQVLLMADKGALRRFGKGSVHTTIYYPEVLAFHVAVPPLAEQHRIVAEVERRLSVLDALAATIDRNLERCEALRQSILKRAFEGRLVPQDPSDEPASELLARIQAEAS